MNFKQKKQPELAELGYADIYVSDEYWMARLTEKYKVHSWCYGMMWQWKTKLLEVQVGRKLDNYLELSRKLLYLAEHSEKPLHKILPSVRSEHDEKQFITQLAMHLVQINHRLHPNKEAKVKKQTKANGLAVAVVEIEITKQSSNGHIEKPVLQMPAPALEPINKLEFAEAGPEEEVKESPRLPAPATIEDESAPVELYPDRIKMSENEYEDFLLSFRPSRAPRNEYDHLSYDLLLEVEIKNDPKPNARKLTRKTYPLYTLRLGRFFRMYPGDFNKDFRNVVVGYRVIEGKKEGHLVFDDPELNKLWPEDVRPLPINKAGRVWEWTDRKLGEYLLEAIGGKPQSILGSKKIYKLKLKPMERPNKNTGEMTLANTRAFVISSVEPKFYANGVIPAEDIEERTAEVDEDEQELEN